MDERVLSEFLEATEQFSPPCAYMLAISLSFPFFFLS